MKTVDEVEDWCAGAELNFGDPSLPVCQLFVKCVEGDSRPKSLKGYLDLFCYCDRNEMVLWLGPDLVIPIAVSNVPQTNAAGELVAFGMEQIAFGVWALNPSLNLPEVIHAFVILYDVPSPAPWERLIVLAS